MQSSDCHSAHPPLWALVLGLMQVNSGGSVLWTLVPGLGLTLLIVWLFRHLYSPPTSLAYLFLAADVLRWESTFMTLMSGNRLTPFPVPALTIPSGYGTMAGLILRSRARRFAASA